MGRGRWEMVQNDGHQIMQNDHQIVQNDHQIMQNDDHQIMQNDHQIVQKADLILSRRFYGLYNIRYTCSPLWSIQTEQKHMWAIQYDIWFSFLKIFTTLNNGKINTYIHGYATLWLLSM